MAHVYLKVALLCAGIVAAREVTEEGLFSCVYVHVSRKVALLYAGKVTAREVTGERLFSCVYVEVPRQFPLAVECSTTSLP
eukprot:9676769-Karenia_brevis.AAC.1